MRFRPGSLRSLPFIPRQHRPVLATGGAMIAAQLLMAIAGVLSARALGPDGKGLVSAVLAWPLILGWAGLFGLNTALSVRVAADDSNLRDALGNALVLSLVSGAGVALIAIAIVPSMLAHLGPHAEVLAAAALATIPLIMLSDVLLSLNVSLGRIRQANISRIASPLLVAVATAALLLTTGLTPASVVLITLAAGAVSLLLLSIRLPWRRLTISARGLAADLRFGVKIHLGGLLGFANMRLDLLLMSMFVSASQIGYYGVANNVMLPVASLSAAAAALLTPAVARLGADDPLDSSSTGQVALIRREARLYLWLAIIGGLALAVASPLLIPLMFGSAFRPALVLVWVLIPGYITRSYSLIVISGTAGMRRAWVGNAVEGAGLVLTLILLPLLLPRYGALGAAITSTAAYAASATVAFFILRGFAGPPVMETAQRPRLSASFRQGLRVLSRSVSG